MIKRKIVDIIRYKMIYGYFREEKSMADTKIEELKELVDNVILKIEKLDVYKDIYTKEDEELTDEQDRLVDLVQVLNKAKITLENIG